MKPLYLDTGLVLKLLVEEPLSPVVRAYLTKQRAPIWFTKIITLEVENTLQAMRHRGQLTPVQLRKTQELLTQLCDEGKFRQSPLTLDAISEEMLRLTPSITSRTGCRTLDLLHIAAARLLPSPKFISTDKRQLAAAKLAGLTTVDLTHR
ncbi:MAG: type II toxin-antitoxin system VapC family toxin [Verrucomicrobiia bacterium]|tara:strand:- start:287 stop:736 length:450 start_codon:yes stop_codon:yes gene_type:complete